MSTNLKISEMPNMLIKKNEFKFILVPEHFIKKEQFCYLRNSRKKMQARFISPEQNSFNLLTSQKILVYHNE